MAAARGGRRVRVRGGASAWRDPGAPRAWPDCAASTNQGTKGSTRPRSAAVVLPLGSRERHVFGRRHSTCAYRRAEQVISSASSGTQMILARRPPKHTRHARAPGKHSALRVRRLLGRLQCSAELRLRVCQRRAALPQKKAAT
ncbi:hypothetical protein HPB48_005134 [Haemaphysalis longicornis]|uniref:Uncharacterized protein n=1 Tax=Haemaphysalis longicornis TaxID=44386 RepID=A0A9J6FH74_HAELO|nr:hypothetical protein HPB48_005134 [Haemaphysalis longicornis]